MPTPRILLAEDQTLLLELFHRLLEPEFEVVGTATDGATLVTEAQRLEPDVIVTDVSMPRMGGIEAARRLRELAPASRVVFLTINEDPRLAAEAFRLGASAWVLKTSTSAELIQAIRLAVKGKRYLTSLVAHGRVDQLPRPADADLSVEQLTPREREVLQLLAEGKLMKEVAGVLGITARTVAFHKYRMMETLGIRSSAELIQFAVKNQVV
jgi:DNA-binding NarL/FixJ family response regulator